MAKGKILYDKIKNRRIEIDVTQQTVSEALGVPRATYASFELGKQDFDEDKLQKLCDFFKIELSDVYIPGFRNTVVVPLINNKGGSGKTTVSNGLSYILSTQGYKVLVIDSDAQMNLTHSLGILDRDLECNLNTALIREESLLNFIKPTKYENLDIIMADYSLSRIDTELATKSYRETLFRRILKPVLDKGIYDYILIDTSANLGLLNSNIMLTSDYCLVPCSIEAFALDGLEILTGFINDCKMDNPTLDILGIVKVKVDKREGSILSQFNSVLEEHFGNVMFDSFIPIDIKIKQSQWNNVPVSVLAENGKSDKNYKELAKEFVRKTKR